MNIGGCIYTPAMVNNVLYAYNNGMQVASHTWSHPYLTSLSQDQGTFHIESHNVTYYLPVVSQMSQIDCMDFNLYDEVPLEVVVR